MGDSREDGLALVTGIEKLDQKVRGTHPTRLVAKYLVGESDGKTVFQLNTYGSDDRQMPDKLSQTIQFNEKAARQLWDALKKEFNFR